MNACCTNKWQAPKAARQVCFSFAHVVDVDAPFGGVRGVQTELVHHRSYQRVKRTDTLLVLHLDQRIRVRLQIPNATSRKGFVEVSKRL